MSKMEKLNTSAEKEEQLKKEKEKLGMEKDELKKEKMKLEMEKEQLNKEKEQLEKQLQTEQDATTITWIMNRISQKEEQISQKEAQISKIMDQISKIMDQISKIMDQQYEKEKQLTSVQSQATGIAIDSLTKKMEQISMPSMNECQEYEYDEVADLTTNLQRMILKENRTFAFVRNKSYPSHSNFSKQNLSSERTNSTADQSSLKSHDYLLFPNPPPVSLDTCYSLEKCFKKLNVNDECLTFIHDVSFGPENNSINAFCILGLQHIVDIDVKCWTYETEFQLCNRLPTLFVSTKFRPDNCIGLNAVNEEDISFIDVQVTNGSQAACSCSICSPIYLKKGFNKMVPGSNFIPVLSFEIVSVVTNSSHGNFRAALQKCALGCYEIFRMARIFVTTVEEWSGFVLPSQKKNGCCPVVKVTVKSNKPYGVGCKAEYQVLEFCNVKEEIESTYSLQSVVMGKVQHALEESSQSSFSYVFRLSEEEVTECGKYFYSAIFGQDPVEKFQCVQIKSAFSFLFYLSGKKEAFFLKHLTDPTQMHSLDDVENTLRKTVEFNKRTHSTHTAPFCLSEKTKDILLMEKYKFHCFKALPPPLDIFEAKECLKQFVKVVCKSLAVLHQVYLYAHTDVRLENICFRYGRDRDPVAIFIDLDRCSAIGATTREKSSSALYKLEFSNEQIDWRQFGCTVYWILKATSTGSEQVKSIHELKVDDVKALRSDLASCGLDMKSICFVVNLIDQGVCDDGNLDEVFLSEKFSTPIIDAVTKHKTV